MQTAPTFLSAEAEWRLTFYCIQLRLHKIETGLYPETLGELATGTGKSPGPPIDPFGGGEFVYRKSGEGFILYSIGKNFTDDGGEEDPDGDDIVVSLAE